MIPSGTTRKPRGAYAKTAGRRREILEAGIDVFATNGFRAGSIREIAEVVGISQAGLLHYVGSKEGLLQLIVEQRYDRRFDPEAYIASGDPAATHPDGASFPGYCRFLVRNNAAEPQLVRLYMVLGAEAISPEHPAHGYFDVRPDATWELYSRTTWRLPPEVGPWEDARGLVEMAIEAMDGVQLRSFRSPAVSMEEGWARFEQVLFPSPVWDGYR